MVVKNVFTTIELNGQRQSRKSAMDTDSAERRIMQVCISPARKKKKALIRIVMIVYCWKDSRGLLLTK